MAAQPPARTPMFTGTWLQGASTVEGAARGFHPSAGSSRARPPRRVRSVEAQTLSDPDAQSRSTPRGMGWAAALLSHSLVQRVSARLRRRPASAATAAAEVLAPPRTAAQAIQEQISRRLLQRFGLHRKRRLLPLLVGVAVGFFLLWRNPAWAVGGLSLGLSRSQPGGSFADRVASYHGTCGSLLADLSVAIGSFVIFACCAGTETAITTLWPWKVREFAQREQEAADRKSKEEAAALDRRPRETREREPSNSYSRGGKSKHRAAVGKWTALREDIQRFIQTILIGATLSGVISTAFITEICGHLFGPQGLAIATITVSLVQLTVGEIVPKSMAVSSPYSFAQATLPLFYRVSAIVYPVSKMLNEAVSIFLGLFGISVDTSKTPYVSEEELDLIFSSAMKSGIVDAEEGEMIRSVRNLDSKRVKEVMTPLVDMICICATEPISKLHELCLETQFSRIPVFDTRFDSIIGVVSMKTLLRHAKTFDQQGGATFLELTVEQICDKPFFVPETMSLLNALRALKERTLAICVDEYGGTTGLVTLEDVLEEIVGEIYDPDEEKDKLERAENRAKIKSLGNGRYTMNAFADIDDVGAVLGLEFPEGDYNSIAGFICHAIDRIPTAGEAVTVQTSRETVRFEVMEVDDRKIVRVEAYSERLAKLEAAKEDGKKDDGEDQKEEFEELASVIEVSTEVKTETEEDMPIVAETAPPKEPEKPSAPAPPASKESPPPPPPLPPAPQEEATAPPAAPKEAAPPAKDPKEAAPPAKDPSEAAPPAKEQTPPPAASKEAAPPTKEEAAAPPAAPKQAAPPAKDPKEETPPAKEQTPPPAASKEAAPPAKEEAAPPPAAPKEAAPPAKDPKEAAPPAKDPKEAAPPAKEQTPPPPASKEAAPPAKEEAAAPPAAPKEAAPPAKDPKEAAPPAKDPKEAAPPAKEQTPPPAASKEAAPPAKEEAAAPPAAQKEAAPPAKDPKEATPPAKEKASKEVVPPAKEEAAPPPAAPKEAVPPAKDPKEAGPPAKEQTPPPATSKDAAPQTKEEANPLLAALKEAASSIAAPKAKESAPLPAAPKEAAPSTAAPKEVSPPAKETAPPPDNSKQVASSPKKEAARNDDEEEDCDFYF